MRRALLLTVLLLAGCGSDDGNNAASGTGTTGTTGGDSVELTATEFAFTPATVQADAAGETTFTLVNDGKLQHALEIEGEGIAEGIEPIDGGQTGELKVALRPGKYEFYCPIGNHREQGMEGTLVVGGVAGGMGTSTEEETDTQEGGGYGR